MMSCECVNRNAADTAARRSAERRTDFRILATADRAVAVDMTSNG